MPKKTKKTEWKRWTEEVRQFPEPKYGFSKLLKHVGDYIETFPMLKEDARKIKYAAYFWAHRKKKNVSVIVIPDYQDGVPHWRVRVSLVNDKRVTNFEDI